MEWPTIAPAPAPVTTAPLGGVPEKLTPETSSAAGAGDWWPWLLVVLLAVALVWQVRGRKRDAQIAATEWRAENLRQNAAAEGLMLVEAHPRSVVYAAGRGFTGISDHIKAQHAIDWGVRPDQVEMAAVGGGMYALRVREPAPGHGA